MRILHRCSVFLRCGFILILSSLAHSNEPMQWRGVRRLSVNFCAKRFFSQANGWIATVVLAHDGLQVSVHLECAQVQGWGERSRDTSTCGISQKSLTQPFPNFFRLSIRFYSASQIPIPKWLWVCAVSSAIEVLSNCLLYSCVRSDVSVSMCAHFMKHHYTPSRLSIGQLDL